MKNRNYLLNLPFVERVIGILKIKGILPINIRSVELKQHIYKLILAFEDTCQIGKGKTKLEDLLDNE